VSGQGKTRKSRRSVVHGAQRSGAALRNGRHACLSREGAFESHRQRGRTRLGDGIGVAVRSSVIPRSIECRIFSVPGRRDPPEKLFERTLNLRHAGTRRSSLFSGCSETLLDSFSPRRDIDEYRGPKTREALSSRALEPVVHLTADRERAGCERRVRHLTLSRCSRRQPKQNATQSNPVACLNGVHGSAAPSYLLDSQTRVMRRLSCAIA
jgi:hypothetical protein